MTPLETFSTAGLTPRRRIEFWNEIACATFTPIVSSPVDLDAFSGALTRTTVGGLRLAEVLSEPSTVRHSRPMVARTREPMFFLHLQLEGESINRQDGREARLTPGDFTICDSTRPYEMVLLKPNRRVILGIPDALLRRHLSSPEGIVALRMSGTRGMGALVSNFTSGFWRCCRQDIDGASALRAAYAMLDLIASAYSTVPQSGSDRSSLSSAHRLRITSFIEAHLRDPDLTPGRIAQACKITTRYLHHLFSGEAETVTRYVLRRRLEECARSLLIASPSERTVTDIAFDFGFNSLTHFGRVFREHYGVTPSEYRRHHEAQRLLQ